VRFTVLLLLAACAQLVQAQQFPDAQRFESAIVEFEQQDRLQRPPGGSVMTDIFIADNLHLNDLGNAIWGATVKAALMPMEARAEQR
jgi:hypothetical protein